MLMLPLNSRTESQCAFASVMSKHFVQPNKQQTLIVSYMQNLHQLIKKYVHYV